MYLRVEKYYSELKAASVCVFKEKGRFKLKLFKFISITIFVLVFLFSIFDFTMESSNFKTEMLMNSQIFDDVLHKKDIRKLESTILFSIMGDRNKKCFKIYFSPSSVGYNSPFSDVVCNYGSYVAGPLIFNTWSKNLIFNGKVIGTVDVYDYPTFKFSLKGFIIFLFIFILFIVFRHIDKYDLNNKNGKDINHTQIFKKNKRKFKVRNDNFVYAVHNNNYCYIITTDLKMNRWRCSLQALSAYLNHETYSPQKGLLINENGIYREDIMQLELNNKKFDIIRNISKLY
ncbi:hypothetical protein [Photobacterium leiognathi]|uniref:hypothetical protein n=1 Tax=Photobacterium leiognathi TaxID=553611 RepID=UPI002980B470|nr:hypothetical protein [Photobacterium leiognathi]